MVCRLLQQEKQEAGRRTQQSSLEPALRAVAADLPNQWPDEGLWQALPRKGSPVQ